MPWPKQTEMVCFSTLLRSEDAGYDGVIVGDMSVLIEDNDVAGLTIGQPGQSSVGEGESTTYSVALRSQPTSPVQVVMQTDGRTQASPLTLTFDAGNWDRPQTVTLTALMTRWTASPMLALGWSTTQLPARMSFMMGWLTRAWS